MGWQVALVALCCQLQHGFDSTEVSVLSAYCTYVRTYVQIVQYTVCTCVYVHMYVCVLLTRMQCNSCSACWAASVVAKKE